MAGLTDDVAVSAIRDAGVEAFASGAWSTAVRFLRHAAEVAGQKATPDDAERAGGGAHIFRVSR